MVSAWVCVCVCVCVRVGSPLFLLCPLFVDFFQRGAKEEEEERLTFWLSHVEIECLKLEF